MKEKLYMSTSEALADPLKNVNLSDERNIKRTSEKLTAKTAPVMVRPCVRRSDADLRNAFRF